MEPYSYSVTVAALIEMDEVLELIKSFSSPLGELGELGYRGLVWTNRSILRGQSFIQ